MRRSISSVGILLTLAPSAPALAAPDLTLVVNDQGSPAANRSAIESALLSVATSGGTVLFPDDNYDIDGGFPAMVAAERMRIASSNPTGRPRIRYVGSTHLAVLLQLVGAKKNVALEGLEFDANYKSSQLVQILNTGEAGEHFVGDVLVRDCVFRHGRQQVWDEGFLVDGIDSMWGHESAAAGVYVAGAFSNVTFQDSVFEDFGQIRVTTEPLIRWGVGSRGAWVTTESDPNCSTPDEYTERPRRSNVLACTFRDISSIRYQHLAGGILVPVDADGVHLGALYSQDCTSSPSPHRDALAVVRDSLFEHCEYRSIKLQLGRAIIQGNRFVTFPDFFGHPRSRGMREDVRHAEKKQTKVHGRAKGRCSEDGP